jgi:hypothetical protein
LWKKFLAEIIVGGALSCGEAHKRACALALALLRQRQSQRKHDAGSSEQEKEKHTTENNVPEMLGRQHFDDMRVWRGIGTTIKKAEICSLIHKKSLPLRCSFLFF